MLITHQKASSKDCYRNATANQRLQRNTQAEGAKKQRWEKGHTQRLTPVSLCEYTEAACAENPTKTKHRQCGVLLLASAPILSPLADYLNGHYELVSQFCRKDRKPSFWGSLLAWSLMTYADQRPHRMLCMWWILGIFWLLSLPQELKQNLDPASRNLIAHHDPFKVASDT